MTQPAPISTDYTLRPRELVAALDGPLWTLR